MKAIVCICLVCLLLVSAGGETALAADRPLPAAQNALLADMDTGAVLYELNARERCDPAGLTKIMTVLLAVEAIEAGEATRVEYITIQADDLRASDAAGLQAGERLRLEELLYCAMLVSSGDASRAVARRLAGSEAEFAARMNERAGQLGCEGTHFSNADGTSAEDHYTTAYDLFVIAREAMGHPLFAEICAAARYQVPVTNRSAKRVLENTNALLDPGGMYGAAYVYDGALGVKSGHTDEQGYCLVSAVERDGVQLMAVVVGCAGSADTGYGQFEQTIALYDWAFQTHARRSVLDESVCAWSGRIAYGRGPAALYPAQSVALFLPEDAALPAADIAVDTAQPAPIEAGAVCGEAIVQYGGVTISVPLVAGEAVARNELAWFTHRAVTSVWFYLAAAMAALAATYVLWQRLAARRRRMRRARHLAAGRTARIYRGG